MKVTTTIATLALATFGLVSCQNTNQEGQRKNAEATMAVQSIPDTAKTYFISADTANKMIKSYLASIGDTSGNTSLKNLQSLIVDAGAIRAYLKDSSIKKVKIMFAHTLQYINDGHNGQPAGYTPDALTIIMAGYNANGDYVLAPGGLVPDRARPCPTNCTLSGTSVSPLLPTAAAN